MEIHLTQSNLIYLINEKILSNRELFDEETPSLYITTGHTVHKYYKFANLKNANVSNDAQWYAIVKVNNNATDLADFNKDTKKLIDFIVGTMTVALDAESNCFKISAKDLVGKTATSMTTYYFIKLDKAEAR